MTAKTKILPIKQQFLISKSRHATPTVVNHSPRNPPVNASLLLAADVFSYIHLICYVFMDSQQSSFVQQSRSELADLYSACFWANLPVL